MSISEDYPRISLWETADFEACAFCRISESGIRKYGHTSGCPIYVRVIGIFLDKQLARTDLEPEVRSLLGYMKSQNIEAPFMRNNSNG
jgi:hypothetical protein